MSRGLVENLSLVAHLQIAAALHSPQTLARDFFVHGALDVLIQ
jgi:hypothetical protein